MILVQEALGGPALEKARALVDAMPLLDAFLVHADLDPSIVEDSRAWLAFDRETGDLRGVATAYSGLGRPALAAATPPRGFDAEVASALLRTMRAALEKGGPPAPWLAIVPHEHTPAWVDAFRLVSQTDEHHYMLPPTAPLPFADGANVQVVGEEDLGRLDLFLREHGATAWSRGSFRTGPYVWAREGDEVLAAAGVHFATPVVGQIANVLVRRDARRRGLGRAVTAAVARRLRAQGRICSLFVRADNAGAIALYEGLGFRRVRTLAALELR